MIQPAKDDPVLIYSLMGMTAVTGIVDAVSFLALGHVFTANMTGNVVLLGFAVARTPEVSVARSLTALTAFLVGAAAGGRIMAKAGPESQLRAAITAFSVEIVFLIGAALSSVGYSGAVALHLAKVYALIAFTAVAMGIRNAAVRRLAVPDLTTTVLTLTITGLAADSSLALGNNVRWQRRAISVAVMFGGAAVGAVVVRKSVLAALALSVLASAVCSLMLVRSSRRVVQRSSPRDEMQSA